MATHLVILAGGTRGDVQPLSALAAQIQTTGIPTSIVARPPFARFAQQAGVGFSPLSHDPVTLLEQQRGALTFNHRPWQNLYASWRYLQQARPLFARMLDQAWQICQHASQIVVSLPTSWGLLFAEALHIPASWALLQPLGATRRFPAPLLPLSRSLGSQANRLSHRLVELSLWLPWRAELSRWCRQVGLAGITWHTPWKITPPHPRIYGISPQVVTPPDDWGSHQTLTGYWWPIVPTDWQPSAKLSHFLAQGSPPWVVDFGSSGDPLTPVDLSQIAIVFQHLGIRGLIAGVSEHIHLPDHLLALPDTPHTWLFPHVAGVIHHGGAGTCAAALRAGRPQLIVASGVDHFFWGTQIAALGVGTWMARRQWNDHTIKSLLDRVRDPLITGNAARFAERLCKEDGVTQAAHLIINHATHR